MRGTLLLFAIPLLAPAQTFEAACIRPEGQAPIGAPCPAAAPGLFIHSTLKQLLNTAFEAEDYQLSGPAWLSTERFEVIGKAPSVSTTEQLHAMLRRLLIERFGIVLRHEQREMDAYTLAVAKGGVRLNPRGSGGLTCSACTMAQFAQQLAGQLHRPVTDGTGLTGSFDLCVSYAVTAKPESHPVVSAAIPNSPVARQNIDSADIALINRDITLWPAKPSGASFKGPTLFAALQHQLGLKLERKKTPVDVIVIDRIDKMPKVP